MEVRTQAEFDAALAKGEISFEFSAAGEFNIRCPNWIKVSVSAALAGAVKLFAWGSSRVVARGSSRVVARESSRVVARESSRVEARESSSVVARESSRVEAWGSSRVEAWESSSVVAWGSSSVVARGSSSVVARGSSRVEAWESSSVVARGSSRVVAWGAVSLNLFGGSVKATLAAKCHAFLHRGAVANGGQQTRVEIKSPQDWCDYYGVTVVDGAATLFKALDDQFLSPKKTSYAPGEIPKASDWDGGKDECGGGLHFSPSPSMARAFNQDATKFAACQVALADMAIHPDGDYPEKCKASGCCAPCRECDEDGKIIETEEHKNTEVSSASA